MIHNSCFPVAPSLLGCLVAGKEKEPKSNRSFCFHDYGETPAGASVGGFWLEEKDDSLLYFCLLHSPAPPVSLPLAFDSLKRSVILINRLLFQEPTSNTLVIFHGGAETMGRGDRKEPCPQRLLLRLGRGQKHPINPQPVVY